MFVKGFQLQTSQAHLSSLPPPIGKHLEHHTQSAGLSDSRGSCCSHQADFLTLCPGLWKQGLHCTCPPSEQSRLSDTGGPRLLGNLTHVGQGSANHTAQGPSLPASDVLAEHSHTPLCTCCHGAWAPQWQGCSCSGDHTLHQV